MQRYYFIKHLVDTNTGAFFTRPFAFPFYNDDLIKKFDYDPLNADYLIVGSVNKNNYVIGFGSDVDKQIFRIAEFKFDDDDGKTFTWIRCLVVEKKLDETLQTTMMKLFPSLDILVCRRMQNQEVIPSVEEDGEIDE